HSLLKPSVHNKDKNMIKTTMKLNVLAVCICLAQHGYALEQIDEQSLSNMTGQDGIVITHEVSRVKIEQANWYDPNPAANVQMGLGLHNAQFDGVENKPILSQLEFDVGATPTGAGIRLAASVSPFTATADLMLVKNTCTSNPCQQAT